MEFNSGFKGLMKNLEAVPGTYSIDSQQKAAMVRTSDIIRKVLWDGT